MRLALAILILAVTTTAGAQAGEPRPAFTSEALERLDQRHFVQQRRAAHACRMFAGRMFCPVKQKKKGQTPSKGGETEMVCDCPEAAPAAHSETAQQAKKIACQIVRTSKGESTAGVSCAGLGTVSGIDCETMEAGDTLCCCVR